MSPAKPSQASSQPHRHAQRVSTTTRKRSAGSAAVDSSSNNSSSRKRRRNRVENCPSVDLTMAMSQGASNETGNSERSTHQSITFPDLEALPKPQSPASNIRRVLSNRAKKILPSVENPPRPRGLSEIVDLEGSSPIACSSDSPEMTTPRGKPNSHDITTINSPHITSTPLPATSTPIKNEPRSIRPFNSTPTRCPQIRQGSILTQDTAVQIFTPRTRRRKLNEDGVVEQPREDYGLEVIEMARRQLKEMESCLLSQERVLKEKRKERECEAEKANRLGHFKLAKKGRHILRETQKVDGDKSRRRETSSNGNSAAAEPIIMAGNHLRLEKAQNAAKTLHSASAKPMSEQVQIQAQNGTNLPSEGQQREQAVSDTVTVVKAHGHDTQNVGEVSPSSNVLSIEKVPQSRDSSKADGGPRTLPRVQVMACPTFKKPMTTPSTADCFHVHNRWDNGSSRGAAAPNSNKYPINRPWVYPHFRRQVIMNHNRRPCVCGLLHPYFLQARWFEPELEDFPGCKAEFLAHAEQVASCEAHSKQLRNYCRLILEREAPSSSGRGMTQSSNESATADTNVESALTLAHRFLSGGQITTTRPNMGDSSEHAVATVHARSSRSELREQSIIPPWEFYGLENSRPSLQRNQREPTPPPSSPPKGVKATNSADHGQADRFTEHGRDTTKEPDVNDCATHEAAGALSDSEDKESESGRPMISPSKLHRALPLRELSTIERIRRHQSLPVRLNPDVKGGIGREPPRATSGLETLGDTRATLAKRCSDASQEIRR